MSGNAFNLFASFLWGITPEYFSLMMAIVEGATIEDLTKLALAAKQQKDHADTLAFIEQRLACLENKPELKSVALQVGQRAQNTRRIEMRDGIAIMPMHGAIFRRANLFSELSGNATSVQVMATDFHKSITAPETKGLIIDADTPGGDINGISEMAGHVYAARESGKPVWLYTGGQCCSAGLWIGRAASKMIVHPTSMLGSIGVMAIIRSSRDNTKTIISSQSPNKNLDPNTAKGEIELQKQVDRAAAFFLRDLSKFSGMTVEAIQEKWGKGGTLFGEDAKDAGMVDDLASYEETIAQMTDAIATSTRRSFAVATVSDVEVTAATTAARAIAQASNVAEERETDTMALSDSLKTFIAGLPENERAELLGSSTTQNGGGSATAPPPAQPPTQQAVHTQAATASAGGAQPDALTQALARATNAECTAFFAAVTNKVTPAERPGLEATYKALAGINDGGVSLEAFKASITARGVHPAMAGETVAADGTVRVLPNDGTQQTDTRTQAEKDAELVAKCLTMTTVGQDAAAALKAGEIRPAAHA